MFAYRCFSNLEAILSASSSTVSRSVIIVNTPNVQTSCSFAIVPAFPCCVGTLPIRVTNSKGIPRLRDFTLTLAIKGEVQQWNG